jgi:CIC family chloride channel protein
MSQIGRILDVESWGLMAVMSVGIGLLCGAAAIVFDLLLQQLQTLSIGAVLAQPPSLLRGALTVAGPTLGGLVTGLLVYRLAPEAEGVGTDAVIRAFHRLGGKIRERVPFIKLIASVVTLGTGGSAGREGPVGMIGAGIGSLICQRLGLDTRRCRIYMLAGASGGIGAMCRAPLGGALFASEVLYREPDFEYEAIVPSIIASITAFALFTGVLGHGLLFSGVEALQFVDYRELLLYPILGVLCAGAGLFYLKFFGLLRDRVFRRLVVPLHMRPAVGGLLLGLLALWLPYVLGTGYEHVQAAIDDTLAAAPGARASETPLRACYFLLLLAFFKMLATGLTVGSGSSGGIFGPSLVIGAMLGGSFAYLTDAILPGALSPATRVSMILVGMGAFFAGAANVPIASLIMVTEMTGSYGLIVPLMLTCTISYVLSRRWGLYPEQVQSQIDSPAHLGDIVTNVLADIPVSEIYGNRHQEFETVPESAPLRQVRELVEDSYQTLFPVTNADGRLTGVIRFRDIRHVINDDLLQNFLLAREMCSTDLPTVALEDDLYQVLQAMTRTQNDALPVVDSLDSGRVIGILTHNDVLAAYDRRLLSIQEGQQREPTAATATPYRSDSVLIEIRVQARHTHLLRAVREIRFPEHALLACIHRGREDVIPRGDTVIEANDRLLVLTKRQLEASVRQALVGSGPDASEPPQE